MQQYLIKSEEVFHPKTTHCYIASYKKKLRSLVDFPLLPVFAFGKNYVIKHFIFIFSFKSPHMQPKITHLKIKVAGLLSLFFVAVITLSNSTGPALAGSGGRTGASFDSGTCSSCHSGGSFGTGVTVQLLSAGSPVTEYIPGGSYTVKIRVTSTGVSSLGYHYGFQAVCVQSSTTNDINNWGTLPSGTHTATWHSRTYVEQSATLSSLTTSFISVPWTAPVSGTGAVIFYAGGCVVNNDMATTLDKGATTSLTINENTTGCVAPTVTATPNSVSCFGYNDGSINISAVGGTGVSGYSWTGPGGYTSTVADITGLSAGTYTLVVAATGGCSDTTVTAVTSPAALTATVTSNAPVCPGATVTFTTTTTGGTGIPSGFTYSWSGPNSFSSALADPSVPAITSLGAGTYSFDITDDNDCDYSGTVNVTLSPVPAIALGPDTSFCPGSSILIGTASPGDTYVWNTTATTAQITVTDTGIYYVAVTNSASCTASDTIHISLSPAPSVSLGPDIVICHGDSASIGTTIPGDTYLWSTAATTPAVWVTDTGNYSVIITNSYGCSGTDTIHVGYSLLCGDAVANVINGNTVSLYPNPASETITIQSNGTNKIQHINLYNEIGAEVYDNALDRSQDRLHIDITKFAAGIYIVRIESNTGIEVKKLTITK